MEGYIELGIGVLGILGFRTKGFNDLGFWGLRDLQIKIYMELGM